MNYNIKIDYNWGKTVVASDGESTSGMSDSTSVIMPNDLAAWASKFGTVQFPEVSIFLTEDRGGACLSFAACPDCEVFSVKEAEELPGGVLTFVLDLPTLKELHAAIGLAIIGVEADKK